MICKTRLAVAKPRCAGTLVLLIPATLRPSCSILCSTGQQVKSACSAPNCSVCCASHSHALLELSPAAIMLVIARQLYTHSHVWLHNSSSQLLPSCPIPPPLPYHLPLPPPAFPLLPQVSSRLMSSSLLHINSLSNHYHCGRMHSGMQANMDGLLPQCLLSHPKTKNSRPLS